MTTISLLRTTSIRDTVYRAAAIHPQPDTRAGLPGWLAQARRAVVPAARRPAFAVRNLPAGLTPARAADLMETTAAAARDLKRQAGIWGWRARVGYPALAVTFHWDGDPPANEPAVIREAFDVIRATEFQAVIIRGADGDGPCTIVVLNTVHPLTGRVYRARLSEHRDDIFWELLRWTCRREGVPVAHGGFTALFAACDQQHLHRKPDRAPWFRGLQRTHR